VTQFHCFVLLSQNSDQWSRSQPRFERNFISVNSLEVSWNSTAIEVMEDFEKSLSFSLNFLFLLSDEGFDSLLVLFK
jgi:hypothetical protein